MRWIVCVVRCQGEKNWCAHWRVPGSEKRVCQWVLKWEKLTPVLEDGKLSTQVQGCQSNEKKAQ